MLVYISLVFFSFDFVQFKYLQSVNQSTNRWKISQSVRQWIYEWIPSISYEIIKHY